MPCFCPDCLRVWRDRYTLDYHCFRHGLSWSIRECRG